MRDIYKYYSTVSHQKKQEDFIKVNGKTSGLEPGDESEHLVPPFVFKCVVCDLHMVLHCGIIDT